MDFYSFDDINARGCCLRFVHEHLVPMGYEVRGDRIQAKWRGGDGFNVAVNERGYFDHAQKEKGGVITLCAMTMFGGDGPEQVQQAQDFLGRWLGLTPKITPKQMPFDYRKQSTRYRTLVASGYHEACKYVYTDADGRPCHLVIRMEHEKRHKEFIQCTPWASSLRDAELHLYNLPAVSKSGWAVVVEGEKDADTLIKWGLPATTCNCGASNWRDSYTEELRGKDVVICRDNDKAGEEHAHVVLRALATAAKSLRVVCPSRRAKGDVTDWANEDGGTKEAFEELMKDAPIVSPEAAAWSDEDYALYCAREANKEPFSNYRTDTKTTTSRNKKGEEVQRETTVKIPRPIGELVAEVHRRFLNFPRRIGESGLFDLDRDTGTLTYLDSKDAFFAWVGWKSKQFVDWGTEPSMVSKGELYARIVGAAKRYEKISPVPDWPRRDDTFYTCGEDRKPTAGHEAFEGLCGFFRPDGECSRILLRALLAAPLYFRRGVQRPCWVIDSRHGRGVGKTTLAEMLARLYDCEPIRVSRQDFKTDQGEVVRRIVSSVGRSSRILLLDNLTGELDSQKFAELVTATAITGRPSYARRDETRLNDLTYVVTANAANVSSDIASRSFFINLDRPVYGVTWNESVMRYIEERRADIFADMMDILSSAHTPDGFEPRTRFTEFERVVLLPMAGTLDAFEAVCSEMAESRSGADTEAVRTEEVGDMVRERLSATIDGFNPDTGVAFIRTGALNFWLAPLHASARTIREMARSGGLPCFRPEVKAFPSSKSHPLHAHGIMYVGPHAVGAKSAAILRLTPDETAVSVAGTAELTMPMRAQLGLLDAAEPAREEDIRDDEF